MKIKNVILLLIISFCRILYGQDRQESVLLSEVFYDTPLNERIAASMPYSNGEFIQLYNVADHQIDIGNWTLKGDGKTELFTFPSNTVILPQSYLIVAYRHIDTPNFKLSELFPELTEMDTDENIIYQRKIILSNSGEGIALKNLSGVLIDSIYYDGTSNKTRPDRLSATNPDSASIDSCLSVQRHLSKINIAGYPNIRRSDWTVAAVAPLWKNIRVEKEAGLFFSYDNAGNRISRSIRNIILESNNIRTKSRGVSELKDEPQPQTEMLTENKITVYPNPTKGRLAIDISNLDFTLENTIQGYTSSGQLVVSRKITSERTEIDLANQPDGLYLIYITLGNEKSVWKIIKR